MSNQLKPEDFFSGLVSDVFFNDFKSDINQTLEFINTASAHRIEYLASEGKYKDKSIENFLRINKTQSDFINSHKAFLLDEHKTDLLNAFFGSADEYLQSLPEILIREQSSERFVIRKDDKLLIKILKFFKIIIFTSGTVPRRTANLFRKLFNKELKPIEYWKHRINYRSVCKLYLAVESVSGLKQTVSSLYSSLNRVISEFWKIDQQLDYNFFESGEIFNSRVLEDYKREADTLSKKLESLKTEIQTEINTVMQEQIVKFNDSMLKTGTIELPASKFTADKIDKTLKQTISDYNLKIKNWAATTALLKDDWVQDIELLILKGELIKHSNQLLTTLNDYFQNKINQFLSNLNSILKRVSEKVSESNSTVKEIEQTRAEFNEETTALINKKIEDIFAGENAAELLDKAESHLYESLNIISENRGVASTDDYTKEISSASVNFLSPREIIQLEIIPSYKLKIKELKSSVFTYFTEYRKQIFDIEQIADFTLETASEINSADETPENNPVHIVQRGIQRAVTKNQKLINDIDSFKNDFTEKYNSALESFLNELMKLTVNENILKLKLILVKAKAVKTARGIRSKVYNKSAEVIKSIPPLLKSAFTSIKLRYDIYKRKLGISETPQHITSEASDFLAETNRALEKLPYIYRRLFRVEPLKDERLFTARESEYAELFKAYKNWLKGRFAPVIFVGEKGSGVSTIFNIALKSVQNRKLLRTDLKNIIYKEEEFLNYLSELLNSSKFETKEDVINLLNNSEQKKIIILENIQHLYLRTVGGFEALKMLFAIISATNKNVFWVVSTTTYSWEYLKKTISISDYFAYLIKLGQMSSKQIIELIDKRHRISGFDLKFELTSEMKKSKLYSNKPENEISDLLKKEFYGRLTQFAGSNISLALLYWMRAAKDFKGSTLIMNPDLEIDVSFLSKIKDEKLFILHSLILHDGMDINTLSVSTGYNTETCKLITMQLIDDGIILNNHGLCIVNPLVYRQLITILKKKNILH